MIFLSGSHIFTLIYNALAQREGRKTTLPTLVSMTGLKETQIQNSIRTWRNASALHAQQIEVITPGKAWKFKAVSGAVTSYPTPTEIAKEVEMGSTHIWKTVLNALMSNAGRVTSKELLAERASTPERTITPIQASQSMLTVMRQPEVGKHIEVLWPGNAWKYHETVPWDATTTKTPKPTEDNTVTSSHTPASAPIRGSVLRYFAQKPGQTVFLGDIEEELGFTKKQVQSAMWHLLNENTATKNDFIVVTLGYAWQYIPNRKTPTTTPTPVATPSSNGQVTPELVTAPAQVYTPAAVATAPSPQVEAPAPASGRVFTELAELPDGGLLLREPTSGDVYRASKLG